MKIELEFSFVQGISEESTDEIKAEHAGMETQYRRMITTLVEGMVRSTENCDIDCVKITLNGREYDNVRPPQQF